MPRLGRPLEANKNEIINRSQLAGRYPSTQGNATGSNADQEQTGHLEHILPVGLPWFALYITPGAEKYSRRLSALKAVLAPADQRAPWLSGNFRLPSLLLHSVWLQTSETCHAGPAGIDRAGLCSLY
jgi:hypothetical protein